MALTLDEKQLSSANEVARLKDQVTELNENLAPVSDGAERVTDLVERLPGNRRKRSRDD